MKMHPQGSINPGGLKNKKAPNPIFKKLTLFGQFQDGIPVVGSGRKLPQPAREFNVGQHIGCSHIIVLRLFEVAHELLSSLMHTWQLLASCSYSI
jgi:hypothetical protein